MPEPVVITRPRPQAEALAGQLAAAGMDAVVLPLLEISPLSDQGPLVAALARLASFALVAFVSPNAVDAALALTPARAWPRAVAIAVLGEGSRQALQRHGVPGGVTVLAPPGDGPSDSEHLLPALAKAQLAGRRVLLVRGEGGRELLADGLRALGAQVVTAAAYARRVPALTPALRVQLTALLARPHTWVITSSEALRGLDALVRALGADEYVAKLQQQHFVVPHARIAQTAHALGLPLVQLSGAGDAGLFAALQSRV